MRDTGFDTHLSTDEVCLVRSVLRLILIKGKGMWHSRMDQFRSHRNHENERNGMEGPNIVSGRIRTRLAKIILIKTPTENSEHLMQRLPVQSSNLRSIGYDPNSEILEIEFHHGGVYQYFNVPSEIYANLLAASSKGQYHAHYIKYRYNYNRI